MTLSSSTKKPITFLFVQMVFSLMVIISLIQAVSALPTPPTNINVLSSGSRQLPTESNSNISAQGGNVTNINIDALTITKAWQGYYGNVTGNIHLDDAVNNSFYVWGNSTSISGEIYASRNSTIQWGSVNCSTSGQRSAEDTYLGLSATDGDSATNTFGSLYHPGFLVGMNSIANNTCYSTNIYVNGSAQNDSFYQVLLADNTSNIIYSTIIENNKYAYNGQVADFQLMVGENEHPGDLGPTTYYFFVEMS
jgi:hypothetical protein